MKERYRKDFDTKRHSEPRCQCDQDGTAEKAVVRDGLSVVEDSGVCRWEGSRNGLEHPLGCHPQVYQAQSPDGRRQS